MQAHTHAHVHNEVIWQRYTFYCRNCWWCFFRLKFCSGLGLPWYNHTGWLGVKHQVTYLLGLKSLLYFVVFFPPLTESVNCHEKIPHNSLRVCMHAHAHTFWNTVKHKHAYTHSAPHTKHYTYIYMNIHSERHTEAYTHTHTHTHTHKTQHAHMYMGK